MKNILSFIWIVILAIVLTCTLSGCTEQPQTTIINTNQFIQEDYNYMCLDGKKTFTQIIICYQAQDKAEKTQNKITNELIKN